MIASTALIRDLLRSGSDRQSCPSQVVRAIVAYLLQDSLDRRSMPAGSNSHHESESWRFRRILQRQVSAPDVTDPRSGPGMLRSRNRPARMSKRFAEARRGPSSDFSRSTTSRESASGLAKQPLDRVRHRAGRVRDSRRRLVEPHEASSPWRPSSNGCRFCQTICGINGVVAELRPGRRAEPASGSTPSIFRAAMATWSRTSGLGSRGQRDDLLADRRLDLPHVPRRADAPGAEGRVAVRSTAWRESPARAARCRPGPTARASGPSAVSSRRERATSSWPRIAAEPRSVRSRWAISRS